MHFVVQRLAPSWGIHVVITPDEAKAADDAGAGKADDVTSTLAGGETGPRKGGGSAKGAQRETKDGAGWDATAVAVDDVVDTPVGIMPDYLEATGDEGEVDGTGMAPAHGDAEAASRGRVPPMDVASATFGSPRIMMRFSPASQTLSALRVKRAVSCSYVRFRTSKNALTRLYLDDRPGPRSPPSSANTVITSTHIRAPSHHTATQR